eukprot:1158214-Pelagomonas_calceolata.AAC.7
MVDHAVGGEARGRGGSNWGIQESDEERTEVAQGIQNRSTTCAEPQVLAYPDSFDLNTADTAEAMVGSCTQQNLL